MIMKLNNIDFNLEVVRGMTLDEFIECFKKHGNQAQLEWMYNALNINVVPKEKKKVGGSHKKVSE